MKTRLNFLVLLLAVLFFSSAFAQTGNKQAPDNNGTQQKPPPKLDRYGDPLPEGAIARLGTIRLRKDGGVGSPVFSPDGKVLVVGGDWHFRVFDTQTGKIIRQIMGGNGGKPTFSQDGKNFLTCCSPHPFHGGRVLQLWDFDKNKIIWEIDVNNCIPQMGYNVFNVEFHPDGNRIVAHNNNGSVFLIDKKTQEIEKIRPAEKSRNHGSSFAIAPDGIHVAVGLEDGTIRILKIPKYGQKVKQTESKLETTKGRVVHLQFIDADVLVASVFYEERKRLKIGSTVQTKKNVTIEIWNIAKKKRIATLKPSKDREMIFAMAVSPNGNLLYAMHRKGIDIWDIQNRKLINRIPPRKGENNATLSGRIAISKDGKLLATTLNSRMVQLWKLSEKTSLLPETIGHSGEILSITWTPDG